MFHAPDKFRLTSGHYGSPAGSGNNGAFFVPSQNKNSYMDFTVIASDEGGWEHVSVSLKSRCPTWAEMCYIKATFWDDDDCVLQFHPPQTDYINCHPFCLHLWRPVGRDVETPPWWMVGFQK
jgi:hypothetical protein